MRSNDNLNKIIIIYLIGYYKLKKQNKTPETR